MRKSVQSAFYFNWLNGYRSCLKRGKVEAVQYYANENVQRIACPSTRLHFCSRSDTLLGMNMFLRSEQFNTWLTGLKDKVGRARILQRIRSAEHGNFGDCEPVGEGVSEMRIHVGPGYRVYFTRRGEVLYLLLLGGDKSSQKRDIRRAIEMARALGME